MSIAIVLQNPFHNLAHDHSIERGIFLIHLGAWDRLARWGCLDGHLGRMGSHSRWLWLTNTFPESDIPNPALASSHIWPRCYIPRRKGSTYQYLIGTQPARLGSWSGDSQGWRKIGCASISGLLFWAWDPERLSHLPRVLSMEDSGTQRFGVLGNKTLTSPQLHLLPCLVNSVLQTQNPKKQWPWHLVGEERPGRAYFSMGLTRAS